MPHYVLDGETRWGDGSMRLKIAERISENDYNVMTVSREREILLDMSELKFLSSKEISRLLIISRQCGKKISFKNANKQIRTTIRFFDLEGIFSFAG